MSCHAFSPRIVGLDSARPALLGPARLAEHSECALSLRRHLGKQCMLRQLCGALSLTRPLFSCRSVHLSWMVQAWAGT